MTLKKNIRQNPLVCLLVAGSHALSGRIRFLAQHTTETISMDDGQLFTIFRHVTLDTNKRNEAETMTVLVIRFKFATLSQKANRLASLLPIPLIIGFPGFKEKIWMINNDTGYWQGVYQWESEEAVEEYKKSFVLGVMNKRALPGSISYKIIPNTDLSEYIRRNSINCKRDTA
ncbi:MAG: YdhR family protein [Chloroflexota bacterium]